MCGIVGARHDWLVQQGLDPAAAMRDAVAALAWRGPDGQGVVRAGAWWLGCARLAIGPPNSRQPVVRRSGRFVGVMNGAITNARELWAQLAPGVEKRAALPNDAWLPLLAVERRDEVALWRLCGHHAYAVADVQTGELVLGRDQYGEKPLLCAVADQRVVAFASTPVALRRLGLRVDWPSSWLAEWFRFGWAPEQTLPVDERHRLVTPAGHGPLVARCDARQRLDTWGDPDAIRAGTSIPARDVRAAVCESTRRCADTAVPVALALSGGIDSSCLAIALHAADRHVPAYQLRVLGTPETERRAAAVVAARTNLDLRRVDVDREVLDALPFLTACAGVPLGDPSILAVHALARAAAGDGIRVLLGGEGADELFLGYRRYRALARLPRLPLLRAVAPRWSMRYGARWLRAVTATDPVTALLAVTPPAFGDAVLSPELAARPCWRDETAAALPWEDAMPRPRDLVNTASSRDLAGYLRCDLLPKVDVACMAAGVEARCPYLERNQFDLLDAGRRRASLGKRRLREAFAADLPAEVMRLPKHGFALPLDRWFRGELPWLDLLAEPRTQQRPHLRPGGIRRVVDLHRRGRADLGHGLYLLVAAELFLRTLDQENTASVGTGGKGAT